MLQHSQSVFTYQDYKEETLSQCESGPKVTSTKITNRYSGDFEGTGILGYMTVYLTQESGTFAGMEQVTGRLGGREGTFVLHHAGTFAQGRVTDNMSVVEGSGTGALQGLSGTAHYVYEHGMQQIPFALDFEL